MRSLLNFRTVDFIKQEKDMPRFHDRLHYRVCDVSSIKGMP